ncbi:MAG: ATP-binding cassette domain-containing protein [Planctomycetaceae bacterium]|nr:ATP-binding cassette domain-containing protein [Planctomycetaceae bacterium]
MNNSDSGLLWRLQDVSLAGQTSPRLDRVSLTLSAGVTAIIGYSGAGKTSLLNLLATLEIPDGGSMEASTTVKARTGAFRLPTYWVPQSGGLWSHFRAEQHLEAVQAGGIGQNSSQSRESTDNWLARFDLSERRQAYPGQLSRGEQSRLSVARALAANPAVLLMDEPLAHVDPVRTPQYWRVIREHLATTGASLVFSTHEPAVAIQESDHVICLKNGSVTATGLTREIYHHPPSCEVARFLGPINWFAAADVAVWLGTESATAAEDVGLRPENIHLTDNKDGAFEILSFRFGGSYAETQLKHRASSQVRSIIHRPAGSAHYEGQTVGLEVIS